MTWGMTAVAGAGLVGGVIAGNSARSAANTSAQAQLQSAQMAADAARFRPVGVTTRYGGSNFQFGPEGELVGAGYEVSPEYQAYQQQLSGLLGQQLQQGLGGQQQYAPLTGAATGLFNLGQQYLAQTPEQTAQQYIAKQQELLAPSRERQYAQLQNQLFQTGRGGLSVGATSARPSGAQGLGASNPELEAYYNAMAQQDAALAAQAQQAGQQQTAFGAGLFGTGANLLGSYQQGQVGALSPFQSTLGIQSGIEQLGQNPLTLSAGLGGQAAAYGAQSGRYTYGGGVGAANTMQSANTYNPYATALINASTNPQLSQGIGNWMRGGNAGNVGGTGSTFNTGFYDPAMQEF
jgi:hypothetical protein